jgi:hypothetical protein
VSNSGHGRNIANENVMVPLDTIMKVLGVLDTHGSTARAKRQREAAAELRDCVPGALLKVMNRPRLMDEPGPTMTKEEPDALLTRPRLVDEE